MQLAVKELKALSTIGIGTMVLVTACLLPKTRPAEAQLFSGPLESEILMVGEQLFEDKSLSEPTGMSCSSCHDKEAGYSSPDSRQNREMGPVAGVVPGRFGFRKPPTVAYAPFLPPGPPQYDDEQKLYIGGLFFDGRAKDAVDQAKFPFLGANEMSNLVHNVGSPAQVVMKLQYSPTSVLFKKVFGRNVFQRPTLEVYDLIARAIADYEASSDVSPFTSKYDAYLEGKASFTPDELTGLRLATGRLNGRPNGLPFRFNAHCMDCHTISNDWRQAKDLWTASCYANLGVPRNMRNPFYRMTDPTNNPVGYNPLGFQFIDYGLGDFLYPLMGKESGNLAEGDPLHIDGMFKTPTLRNVDKRPYPGFVKSYMHNGVFKSLKQVVHFYNTRNLTTYPGEVIDFRRPNPYEGLKGVPLWAPPEWPSPLTLINPQGDPGGENEGQDGMVDAEIGNITLSDADEDKIVAFLKTLSDGYFKR